MSAKTHIQAKELIKNIEELDPYSSDFPEKLVGACSDKPYYSQVDAKRTLIKCLAYDEAILKQLKEAQEKLRLRKQDAHRANEIISEYRAKIKELEDALGKDEDRPAVYYFRRPAVK